MGLGARKLLPFWGCAENICEMLMFRFSKKKQSDRLPDLECSTDKVVSDDVLAEGEPSSPRFCWV